MKAIALAVLVVLLPSVALANELFSQRVTPEALEQKFAGHLQELGRAEGLRGTFVQKKKLSGIARPLTSSGNFLFVRGRGILWHTTTPFDSEFVLTARAMEITEDGGVAMRVQTAEQPGLRLVSDIFLAMFALDFSALGRHFDMYAADEKPWRIGLAPRDAALRAVAARIVLAGDSVVTGVTLEDANGDSTAIVFGGVQHLKSVPSTDLERFGR